MLVLRRSRLELVIFLRERNSLRQQGQVSIQEVAPSTAFFNRLGIPPEGERMFGRKKSHTPPKSWLDYPTPEEQPAYMSAEAILKNCINSV